MRAVPVERPNLNCPGCDGSVAADEAICPHCDHIIDTSFLVEEAPAPAPRPARRPAPGGGRPPPPRRRPPGPRPGAPRPSRAAAPASAASRYGEAPPDDDDYPAPVPVSALSGHPEPPKKEAFTAPDEAIADFSRFYRNLGFSDRLSFFGAAAVVISCFFPWKSTLDDGDVLGIMDLGVIALITGAMVMGAVAIRVQRVMPRLHPLIPWLVQLAGAAFTTLWVLILLRLSWDSTEVPSPIGNYQMWRSSPSIGAWVGLGGAIVAMVGSLLGLREKAR